MGERKSQTLPQRTLRTSSESRPEKSAAEDQGDIAGAVGGVVSGGWWTPCGHSRASSVYSEDSTCGLPAGITLGRDGHCWRAQGRERHGQHAVSERVSERSRGWKGLLAANPHPWLWAKQRLKDLRERTLPPPLLSTQPQTAGHKELDHVIEK